MTGLLVRGAAEVADIRSRHRIPCVGPRVSPDFFLLLQLCDALGLPRGGAFAAVWDDPDGAACTVHLSLREQKRQSRRVILERGSAQPASTPGHSIAAAAAL